MFNFNQCQRQLIHISLDILFFLVFLFNISFLDVSLKVLLIVSPKVSLMSFKVLLSLDFKVSLIVSLIVLLLKIELYE